MIIFIGGVESVFHLKNLPFSFFHEQLLYLFFFFLLLFPAVLLHPIATIPKFLSRLYDALFSNISFLFELSSLGFPDTTFFDIPLTLLIIVKLLATFALFLDLWILKHSRNWFLEAMVFLVLPFLLKWIHPI